MNRILLYLIGMCLCTSVYGQITCSATGDSGSGYPALETATFGIESPDCEHTSFGPHITQAFDTQLDRNVFVFHSHITADNDRCQVLDRVRMEVKGGPGTSTEMQHVQGETSYYRWKFRLPADFRGASTFNHIFQNKAKGGNDDSYPVIVMTARSSVLEVSHNGGATGTNLGRLAFVNLDQIRGRWVEAYIKQVHAEVGSIEVTLRDMETGLTLLAYENNNIDLWRVGAEYNRPKWGMYRSKNSTLKDEVIRLSDFCVSEVDSMLCPAEAVLAADTIPPTAPTELAVISVSMTTVDLKWVTSEDIYGVTSYIVVQNGTVVSSTEHTTATVVDLEAGTSYTFEVQARDAAGNISAPSTPVTVTTDAATALPSAVSSPFPADEAVDVSTSTLLSWITGTNTDSFNIYLGVEEDPPLVSTQTGTEYKPTIADFTTYYWKIGALNANGETLSDIWTFTSGAANPDLPWLVYRANDKPEIETAFYSLNEAPTMATVDQISQDPNGSSNTYYSYRSDTDGEKFRWRHDYTASDSVVTVVARLQALDPDVNGVCYFEFRANGYRQKIRINQSTIKLERSSPAVEVDIPTDIVNEMQVLRFVSDGLYTAVFINEGTEPIATAVSDTPTSTTYFEWGKSGGADYGATVDWIALDKTGGYPPSEGTALPSDLFMSSIATLQSLTIDGEVVPNFSPAQTEYMYTIEGTEVPQLDWQTTSPLATVSVENPPNVPNTASVVTVIAQDQFTNRAYTVNYIMSTAVENIATSDILHLFPNPAKDLLSVRVRPGKKGVATIYTSQGEIVESTIFIKNTMEYDISHLQAGAYIFSYTEDGVTIPIQLIKTK